MHVTCLTHFRKSERKYQMQLIKMQDVFGILTCPVSYKELNFSFFAVKAFPGAFTELEVDRADEIAFICRLDLFFYPFDVQVYNCLALC